MGASGGMQIRADDERTRQNKWDAVDSAVEDFLHFLARLSAV